MRQSQDRARTNEGVWVSNQAQPLHDTVACDQIRYLGMVTINWLSSNSRLGAEAVVASRQWNGGDFEVSWQTGMA